MTTTVITTMAGTNSSNMTTAAMLVSTTTTAATTATTNMTTVAAMAAEMLPWNTRVGLAIFKVIVTILVIASNTVMLPVIAATRALRNPQGFFMLSMTTADLLQGLFLLPFIIEPGLIGYWPYPHGLCRFTAYLTTLFMAVSLWSMAGLSFDRFLAIKFPLRYHDFMNGKRAIAMILTIWVVFLFGLSGPIFGFIGAVYVPPSDQCLPNYIEVPFMFPVTSTYMLIPYWIIVILNIWNLLIARRHWREINDMNVAQKSNDKKEIKSNLKAAKTVSIMVAVLILTWSPIILLLLVKYILSINSTEPIFEIIHLWFVYVNSFFNCLVYTLRTRQFRVGAKRLWRQITCRGNSFDENSRMTDA